MSSRADFINQQLCLVDGRFVDRNFAKHQKMCCSPFVFFRGSSQIFYADLAVHNMTVPSAFVDAPLTTVMGDCHSSNFGFFTEEGSHTERVVFSINDFDDACVGHAYWDVLRYLVSIALVAEHCQGVHNGHYTSEKDYSDKAVVDDPQIELAMNAFLDAYSFVLEQGIEHKATEENFLDDMFQDFATPSPLQKRYKKAKNVALGGDQFLVKSALAKAVDFSSFPLKFRERPDKFSRKGIDPKKIKNALSPYFYDSILDAVYRTNSGTGSVNMGRIYLLIGPKNMASASEIPLCHVIEVKQQRTAAPLYYFPNLHHQNHLNPAHLTVKCQRRMQRRQDYCLDEAYFDAAHWLIRSRHHAKVGLDPEHIGLGKVNVHQGGFVFYASACGQELARAHSRGDRRSLCFERAMFSALLKHKQELVDCAKQYAEQVKDDWQWFRQECEK